MYYCSPLLFLWFCYFSNTICSKCISVVFVAAVSNDTNAASAANVVNKISPTMVQFSIN